MTKTCSIRLGGKVDQLGKVFYHRSAMMKDEKFMRRALKLARLGGRAVAPNPMVGAVIMKGGKVIGEGYHEKFGGAHAEVNAIRSVKQKSDLVGATMYVTLEPCRHYGKTPPCADAIAQAGIARIVCGSRDPFQKSAHPQHWEFLKGRVAHECRELNKFFFTWVEKKRPYITVKIAMSADGFVAGEGGRPVRLTSIAQDREVHRLRAQHQAILVGIGAVLADDPRLTVRYGKGADPLRIILDSQLRIPPNAKVLKDGNHLIATTLGRAPRGVNFWKSPTKKRVCLRRLFKYLASIGILSVLVEPGPTLYASLKEQGLIDELIVMRGKKNLGRGLELVL
ncbi:MAG: bifunctional diaminohydroxyphosphoribosylaminopyrimidine deaminase/5-amino-6-(5-phosphoribosylamino)uracil reductase RibD [Candidatus Peregrinibacteria bacterium]